MGFIKKITGFIKGFRILLIFLAGIAILVMLFPKGGKFKYEFQIGRPWAHPILVAPFNFPIYKTDELLKAQRDSVLQKFIPYFRVDSSIKPGVMEKLNSDYISKWETYSAEFASNERFRDLYYRGIVNLIEQVYDHGIVLDLLHNESAPDPNSMVNLISGNLVESRLMGDLFTQKQAYEYLKSGTEKLASQLEAHRIPANRFIESFELINYIEPDVHYDEETSSKVKQSLTDEISISQGMVQAGEKIIALGEVVSTEKFQILQSLKREYETNPAVSRNYTLIVLGQVILGSILFLLLFLFLRNYTSEIISDPVKTSFIIMLVIVIAGISAITLNNERISLYVVPFVIVPIILKTFFNTKIAVFVHCMSILVIGFWAPNGFEFVLMNLIAGAVAMYAMGDMYRRGNLFITAVLTFISYSIIYTGLALMQEGRFESINPINYAWFGGNSFLILTSYPLIYFLEKTFGFLSDATLLELSDINQPLLRKMAEHAPGTFQHSIQVANLAEEGAVKVGVNPLLLRAAALYHDIGKLDDPTYYIENQTNHNNPHDNMSYEESAQKIISHVTRGIEYGKKIKLPARLLEFIPTHHGSTTVQYFYKSFKNKFPEIQINSQGFTYPGPRPFSKETAILMMADSIEAASRSLRTPDLKSINDLVDGIIKRQFEEKQFENVDLTFRDIETLKQVFKDKLLNIYHVRIEYPK